MKKRVYYKAYFIIIISLRYEVRISPTEVRSTFTLSWDLNLQPLIPQNPRGDGTSADSYVRNECDFGNNRGITFGN